MLATSVVLKSYISLEVLSQGIWVLLPMVPIVPLVPYGASYSSGISYFSNQAPQLWHACFLAVWPPIFKLKLDLHALTVDWFSLPSVIDLSSRNWVRSYLIVFPLWKWDDNPHHNSFQEPCHSSLLKYWFLSAGNAISFRSRILFHWFAASPSSLLIAKWQLLGGFSLSMHM